MTRLRRILVGGLIGVLSVLFMNMAVLPSTPAIACGADDNLFGIIPTWHKGLEGTDYCDGDRPKIPTSQDSIPKFVWIIVLNCVDILMRLAGVIAVVMILYNAYQYISNNGSEQRIATAKTSLLQITFGLVIVITSSVIIRFIVSRLGQS